MFFFFKRYPLRLCPRRPSPSPRAHCGSSTVALHAWLAGKPLSSLFLKQNKKPVLLQTVAVGFGGREEGGPAVPVPGGPPRLPPRRATGPRRSAAVTQSLLLPRRPRPQCSGPLPPPQQQWLLPPVLLDLLYKPVLCCRRPGPGNEIQPNPSLPTLCPLPFCI